MGLVYFEKLMLTY